MRISHGSCIYSKNYIISRFSLKNGLPMICGRPFFNEDLTYATFGSISQRSELSSSEAKNNEVEQEGPDLCDLREHKSSVRIKFERRTLIYSD